MIRYSFFFDGPHLVRKGILVSNVKFKKARIISKIGIGPMCITKQRADQVQWFNR